ncbi:zinc finger protein 454-like [Anopheles nili]|uniref:zinc finger protein 454-like n=1 Tax=Anopheles nili TaxID=185578 RepID=UPI00237B1B66|nr:zinc finger protein 454-like [Anopheles nili]
MYARELCCDWFADADDDVCMLPLITANDNSVIAKDVTFEPAEYLPPTLEELPYAVDFLLFEPSDPFLFAEVEVEKQSAASFTPIRSSLSNVIGKRRLQKEASSAKPAALTCNTCNLRFICKTHLTRHQLLHHGDEESVKEPTSRSKSRCRLCRECLTSVKELETHLATHHPQKHACEVCLTTFHDEASLEWHRNSHISEETPHPRARYVCDVCQKQCASSSQLHLHRKIHLQQKPYLCSFGCGKSFASSGNRQKHVARVHTHERKYRCVFCAESFMYARQLELHRERHHTETMMKTQGAIVCFKCKQPFQCEDVFRRHQNTVQCVEHRAFECTHCGKRFKQRTHLRNHLLTHAGGVRPYGCEFCTKRFKIAGDLRIHRRIHTKEKPFRCNLCPAAFIMGKQLNKHRFSVHVTEIE